MSLDTIEMVILVALGVGTVCAAMNRDRWHGLWCTLRPFAETLLAVLCELDDPEPRPDNLHRRDWLTDLTVLLVIAALFYFIYTISGDLKGEPVRGPGSSLHGRPGPFIFRSCSI